MAEAGPEVYGFLEVVLISSAYTAKPGAFELRKPCKGLRTK